MTTREELRGRIADLFRIARQEGALRKWADGKADAYEVLALEDRLGIVLKVDRELPENPYKAMYKQIDEKAVRIVWDAAHSRGFRDGWACGRDDLLAAGYVAVEPLREERE